MNAASLPEGSADQVDSSVDFQYDPGQVVESLLKTAAERAAAERSADQARDNALRQAQADFQRASAAQQEANLAAAGQLESSYKASLGLLEAAFATKTQELEEGLTGQIKKLRDHLSSVIVKAEKERDEAIWHASTNADSKRNGVEADFNALRRRKNEMAARLEQLSEGWTQLGIAWPEEDHAEPAKASRPPAPPALLGEMPTAPDLSDHEAKVAGVEALGKKLTGFLPRKIFATWMIPVWAGIGAGLALALKLPIPVLAGGLGVVGVAGHLVGKSMFKKLGEQAVQTWLEAAGEVESLDEVIEKWRESARSVIHQNEEELRETATTSAKRTARLEQMESEAQLASANITHAEGQKKLDAWKAAKLAELNEAFARQKEQIEAANKAAVERINQQNQAAKEQATQAHGKAWGLIREGWAAFSQATNEQLDQWRDWQKGVAPNWNALATAVPQLANPAGALTLAQGKVPTDAVPDFISADAEIRRQLPNLENLPLLRPLPGPKSTLWVQAPPGRRNEMSALLQTIALRALAAFPPGQLRFTLIDPVGLGQTFAGLLHLADFEPALVNQRPWTESRDIEARLAELTTHLEFVVQNYLRNQYATIEDYNRDAGEVAEAYRLLILADWPYGATDESARRLRRLIEAGSRCGIYVVIGHDLSQPGPIDPNQAELRRVIDRIAWSNDKGRWSWPNHPLDKFDLAWDQPPDPQAMTKIVREIGARAKTALRVEVPFSVVAPPAAQIWSQSSARGIDIPLGRAGARQLQSLKLGEGTSQHVLLAGRTGSGKSTLLHAIVTNAALRYSPDELELYLVDFKKGVEFKNYATRELPHARVVAVESEREFGLSVLEKLDRELTERGERFRRAGVQDVAGFRTARPAEPLPRVLLVVDEFQELFNEDDRLSTDAAALLDRLVRQGRAFGIHAILGSQSMAGAYAIARSTMGQMGVRVALQCNENDSRLILSEDNPAARMLSRPGEAIYNDANGLVEGNHLFQAVWISDKDREQQLAAIHAQATARGWERAEPMIVFEGQSAGDIRRNKAVLRAINPAMGGEEVVSATAHPTLWLGESVTISDPPPVALERQPAANVLVVGRNGQEIRPMLAAGLLGIAITAPQTEVLLVESPAAGETSLKSLAEGLPLSIRAIEPAKLKADLTALWENLHARQDDAEKAATPMVFMINDIARLRDLRKSDDDYGFGGFGGGTPAPPSPTKMLGEILRDGPAVGIHTVLWTDGSVSLQHTTERTALNEFGTLVMFQTTAGESTHFLDNVAASRIDRTQALIVRPAEGETLKIRPYGKVEPELWREWMAKLAGR